MSYTNGLDNPKDYFEAIKYAGDGNTTQAITANFQLDLSWIKHRSTTAAHTLQDSVRGFNAANKLSSNEDDAENDANGATWENYGHVSAVSSSSFTVNRGANTPYQTNASGINYIAWNWKAGGSASSNSNGSITSSVSANTTAGFSIATFTTPSADGDFTVGHGLGVVPKLVIVKTRGNADNWQVYHHAIGNANVLNLNNTNASASTGIFGSTTPTSSVFTLNKNSFGGGLTAVSYCFVEKKSYSRFGSYKGNGSTDGPFVYTGFKPAWLLIKQTTDSGQQWEIFDNKRDGYNDANRRLFADANSAEPSASNRVRICSNGFKLVTSGGTHVNGNGKTHIYMAFAESPFVNSNGVPTTAR